GNHLGLGLQDGFSDVSVVSSHRAPVAQVDRPAKEVFQHRGAGAGVGAVTAYALQLQEKLAPLEGERAFRVAVQPGYVRRRLHDHDVTGHASMIGTAVLVT